MFSNLALLGQTVLVVWSSSSDNVSRAVVRSWLFHARLERETAAEGVWVVIPFPLLPESGGWKSLCAETQQQGPNHEIAKSSQCAQQLADPSLIDLNLEQTDRPQRSMD